MNITQKFPPLPLCTEAKARQAGTQWKEKELWINYAKVKGTVAQGH